MNNLQKALNRMLIPLFLLALIFSQPLFSAERTITFRDKITHGKEGDYIVLSNRKMYTLLLIKQMTPASLLIEEISIPEGDYDKEKTNWAEWIANFAPGHTSWSAFEIDLADNTLKEYYSFTERGWIEFELSDYIYSHLLTLPLKRTPLDQRHRIGPPPPPGELDARSLWSPSLYFQGKKREKAQFDVWKTRWPSDGLIISDCEIELYFDASSSFPFPYWIEIKGSHYTFKMPVVDSGHAIKSPQQPIPFRPPEFIGGPQKKESGLAFTLKSPAYYKKLTLYVVDANGSLTFALPVPFTQKKGEGKEQIILEVAAKDLNTLLTVGKRYRWIAIPEEASHLYAETEDALPWNP